MNTIKEIPLVSDCCWSQRFYSALIFVNCITASVIAVRPDSRHSIMDTFFASSGCPFTGPSIRCIFIVNTKRPFTRRESAPANRATRATRLEGLAHSPPLHATHLTGTVSGLRELSFERPLSTTKKIADQRDFYSSYFSLLHGCWHEPVLCLRLIFYIDLFRLTLILFGI